jgi:phenylpropionate dioxygenase-like ring-hydroxylating dioxygenase large terminal subunit
MTAVEPRTTSAPNRSRGVSYQELLDGDSRQVPAVLRLNVPVDDAPYEVSVERYVSRAAHEREIEKIWKKCWQMACREEDIPNVGDFLPYEVATVKILVVRTAADTIKAFHNVCLHRGRLLKESCGTDDELRCAFHGFAWNMDGSLKHVPCGWDFPHIPKPDSGDAGLGRWSLPEVKVETWGGFVFVNPDPDAAPLAATLGDLPLHFQRWPLEDRYKQAHVAKVLNCNWKVAQEAFMEAYHVVATHPQLLPSMGDANSQYDDFGEFCRALTPNGTPSPHLKWEPTEQDMLDAMMDRNLDEPQMLVLGDDEKARATAAAQRREGLKAVLGDAADELSDAEMVDSMYYTLFPNLHPWASYNRITYRFRPYKNHHDKCIMECMFLSPFVGERPPSAPIHWLDEDQDWVEAPELGMLARVFNQDVFNLPKVQAGLEGMTAENVTFARYGETKLRYWHRWYDHFMAK